MRTQPGPTAYRILLGRFQGLLTGLTGVSKLASEDVLNHDFERVFFQECSVLRAPPVTLEFPGRRGQAGRRKSVARDHSLAEILSEGEQEGHRDRGLSGGGFAANWLGTDSFRRSRE